MIRTRTPVEGCFIQAWVYNYVMIVLDWQVIVIQGKDMSS